MPYLVTGERCAHVTCRFSAGSDHSLRPGTPPVHVKPLADRPSRPFLISNCKQPLAALISTPTSQRIGRGAFQCMNHIKISEWADEEKLMRFLSWKRASTLYKLQKAIVPPHQSPVENLSSIRYALATGRASESGLALEEYFDLCESDTAVRRVMECEDLVRFDLRGVLMRLLQRGLGEWVNSQYVALSTIAHAESLQYFVRSERQGVRPDEIYIQLIKYWQRRISSAELLGLTTEPQILRLYVRGRERPLEIRATSRWEHCGFMWRNRER
jgi:hypothetical protein